MSINSAQHLLCMLEIRLSMCFLIECIPDLEKAFKQLFIILSNFGCFKSRDTAQATEKLQHYVVLVKFEQLLLYVDGHCN